MSLDVSRVKVWAASIEDCPGTAADKLDALAAAGANLEFVIARRTPEGPGDGVVFLAPLTGAKQAAAARKAGFTQTKSLHSIRAAGPNKKGAGAEITRALGQAGINLRGISAAAIGRKFVLYLAFDAAADATAAARVLKKL